MEGLQPLLVPLGVLLIVASLVDVFWTITPIGSPPGLIGNRLTGRLWQLALKAHRRRPAHGPLALFGVILFALVPLTWVAVMWAGWSLLFMGADGAVISASTRAPADTVERIYFAATQVFTSGNGDFIAGRGWHLPAALAAASGLGVVTLAVTYLVPALGAAVGRRRLARTIDHLGADWQTVRDQVVVDGEVRLTHIAPNLSDDVAAVAESHLAYPALHYLHNTSAHASLALRMADLARVIDTLFDEADAGEVECSAFERRKLSLLLRSIDDLARTLLTEQSEPRPDDERDEDPDEDEMRDERLAALAVQEGWPHADVAVRAGRD